MATHPTVGDMIKHPYGVVENYVDPDGQIYLGVYANAVNQVVPSFEYHYSKLLLGFLARAAASERSKEISLINDLMKTFTGNNNLCNSTLYKSFLELYSAVLSRQGDNGIPEINFSIIIDTAQKMKMGLYDLDLSVKENFEIFKNINEAFLDKNIIEELRKTLSFKGSGSNFTVLPGLNLEMTGNDFINEVVENVKTKMLEAVNNSGLNKTSKNGQLVYQRYIENIEQITVLYKEKLGEFYTKKFLAIDEAEKIKETKLKDLEQAAIQNDAKARFKKDKILVNKEGNPKTFHKVIIDAILGSLGGKTPEYLLDIRHGGMNTGNLLNAQNKSIDADNIQIANAKLEYHLNYERDKKWDNISTFHEFQNELKAINDFESKFVIMTSDKDQSVSADFKNKIAHSDVKIKGEAALKSRATEIIEMYNMIDNAGSLDPTDLIFSIANLAQEFVCNGQKEQARRTLGAICVGWMFDDVKQIVTNSSFIEGTNLQSIHFYNINNYFYTLSDILYKTANALESPKVSDHNKYVKIGISVPKDKIYAPMVESNSPEDGLPRWDAVSDYLLNNIKIDIHMNPNALFQDLFGNIFGVI